MRRTAALLSAAASAAATSPAELARVRPRAEGATEMAVADLAALLLRTARPGGGDPPPAAAPAPAEVGRTPCGAACKGYHAVSASHWRLDKDTECVRPWMKPKVPSVPCVSDVFTGRATFQEFEPSQLPPTAGIHSAADLRQTLETVTADSPGVFGIEDPAFRAAVVERVASINWTSARHRVYSPAPYGDGKIFGPALNGFWVVEDPAAPPDESLLLWVFLGADGGGNYKTPYIGLAYEEWHMSRAVSTFTPIQDPTGKNWYRYSARRPTEDAPFGFVVQCYYDDAVIPNATAGTFGGVRGVGVGAARPYLTVGIDLKPPTREEVHGVRNSTKLGGAVRRDILQLKKGLQMFDIMRMYQTHYPEAAMRQALGSVFDAGGGGSVAVAAAAIDDLTRNAGDYAPSLLFDSRPAYCGTAAPPPGDRCASGGS